MNEASRCDGAIPQFYARTAKTNLLDERIDRYFGIGRGRLEWTGQSGVGSCLFIVYFLWNRYQGPIDATTGLQHSCVMNSRSERSTGERPLVAVVDDDESVRESLPDLLGEFGFATCAFSSGEEYLASDCVDRTKCLILDIAMPGMSGPDLQRALKGRGQQIPIVFITAQRDETVRPRMLEQGAVECLFKPFSDTALLEAVNAALQVK